MFGDNVCYFLLQVQGTIARGVAGCGNGALTMDRSTPIAFSVIIIEEHFRQPHQHRPAFRNVVSGRDDRAHNPPVGAP